jgi:hypothetical protein
VTGEDDGSIEDFAGDRAVEFQAQGDRKAQERSHQWHPTARQQELRDLLVTIAAEAWPLAIPASQIYRP